MLEEQFPYNRKICAVNVSLLFSSDFVTNSYGESWDSCSQKSRVPVDCKTVGFFLKIIKEIGKAWRKSRACEAREKKTDRIFSVSPQSRSLFSASFQTFC